MSLETSKIRNEILIQDSSFLGITEKREFFRKAEIRNRELFVAYANNIRKNPRGGYVCACARAPHE
jgi:hypothetical protein